MVRLIAALAAALIWTALAVAPAKAADKVVLMLNWYVYGEHAPFFYGKAKGIYAAENIDLEIQEGRGSAATTQAVAAKTADFGYVDVPTMMRAAIKGRPRDSHWRIAADEPDVGDGFRREKHQEAR
jgi:NitT/TauT family transport system substrate-binding protein